MIVRKYCERKRGRARVSAKEKNKKDLMGEFQTELREGTSTDVGLRYEEGRSRVGSKT